MHEEINEIALILKGMCLEAPAGKSLVLERAAYWLNVIKHKVCGAGFVCNGGPRCQSDHK